MPIAIINQSTVVPDSEIKALIGPLQTAVSHYFAPLWRVTANVVQYTNGQKVPPNAWAIVILDDSDSAGALGYHETTSQGMPLSKVFAKADLQYGASLSVTLSHELFEMLADPWTTQYTFNQTSDTAGTIIPWEICDACEDDSLATKVQGVLISDFVTPQWFSPDAPAGSQFDFGRHLSAPLSLAKGGYMSRFEVPGGSWSQVDADGKVGPVDKDNPRFLPRSAWRKSTAI